MIWFVLGCLTGVLLGWTLRPSYSDLNGTRLRWIARLDRPFEPTLYGRGADPETAVRDLRRQLPPNRSRATFVPRSRR